jgi:hypothetical protein
MPKTPAPPETVLTEAAFRDIVKQANAGDGKALARLRDVLDANPDLWQRFGNLPDHAERTLVRTIAGGDQLLAESVRRSAQNLRRELGAETASPLDRLAIERVVACWLQMQHADVATVKPTGTFHEGLYFIRRQDSAHRRFDAAMKMLLLIRHVEAGAGRSIPPLRLAAAATAETASVAETMLAEEMTSGGVAPVAETSPTEASTERLAVVSPGEAAEPDEAGAAAEQHVNGHVSNGHVPQNRLAALLKAVQPVG